MCLIFVSSAIWYCIGAFPYLHLCLAFTFSESGLYVSNTRITSLNPAVKLMSLSLNSGQDLSLFSFLLSSSGRTIPSTMAIFWDIVDDDTKRFLSHEKTKADLTDYLAKATLDYNKNSPQLVITSASGHTRSNRSMHFETTIMKRHSWSAWQWRCHRGVLMHS